MASWGWDVTDDLKDLEKRRKQLETQLKKAPDAAKHKARKDQIDKQINDKKLEYAQKQFDLEQKKLELKAARDIFQYHLQQQKEEAKIKEQHFQHLSSAKSTLQSKFSGSKITNPDEKKKQVENEVRNLKLELQVGHNSPNEEKMIIRTIEMKKQELELIQGYIENNVGQYQKEYEATAKEFSGVMQTWKEKVKKTDDASKAREELKKETEALNVEKTEISEEIKELATKKQDIQKKYQQEVKDYEKNRREQADLVVAISMKHNRDRKKKESKQIMKKHEEKQQRAQAREEKAKQEAYEKQKATEAKRQKAIEAYNNMQKKLKLKNASVSASKPVATTVTTGGSTKKAAVTSSRVDPHAAEKETCRSLIVLCESMVPTGRKGKKKKKVRLVYRADSFVKFNQVGVKIPKYAKQLDATIKALNDRIASYDEEPVEVTAEKEAAEEPAEKEVAEKTEEAAETEEPEKEKEETTENQI